MELELDRTQRSGYEAVLDTTICREETLESIVPDACPDILRICDTEGVVCLRDKVLQDGRVELSGSVRAALLYLPDGEEGIRRMEVELPFSCTLEHPALTPLCRVVALPRVQGADARLINPRKVLVRVDLAFCVQVYAPVEDDICSGVLARRKLVCSRCLSSVMPVPQSACRRSPLHFLMKSACPAASRRRKSC